MSNTTEGLSPLAAYEELMHFAKRRGELALRLAMHAAVPQGIQPELLHLLKRNFVPEAGDDPTVEADILFSALCEELGRGYFRFHPQVRALLLENLTANYSTEPDSRIRKVADFLLAYIDHHDRSTSVSQDQLWRDYLEMQRWVAFAFVNPPGAAQQLAAALETANSTGNYVARIQLGGLASALAAPLAGFPALLNYAAGLQALELGDRQTAGELFETLQEEEIKIGSTTLRPVSQILNDWQARHPGYVGPAGEGGEPESSQDTKHLIAKLRNKNVAVRRQAAERLAITDEPELAVPALIDTLRDRNVSVRMACVDSLAQIGGEAGLLGITRALANRSLIVGERALRWLNQRNQRLVLIGGFFRGREKTQRAISEAVLRHGYLPVISYELSDRQFSEVAKTAHFVIVDIGNWTGFFLELKRIQKLQLPVQLIVKRDNDVSGFFKSVERIRSASDLITYDTIAHLQQVLDEIIPSLVSKTSSSNEPQTFEYDVFISHAPPDLNAVVGLYNSLLRSLRSRIREGPKIFVNAHTLNRAKWDVHAIEEIDKSAVFLVFLSHAFLESKSCQIELEKIMSTASRSDGGSRVLKVLRHPIPLEEEPTGLRGLLSHDFFDLDKSGKVRPLLPDAGEADYRTYEEKINRLTLDIIRSLELTRPGRVGPTEPTVAPEKKVTPVEVLVLYDHKDERFRDELATHLKILERRGIITAQHDLMVMPGFESYAEIEQRLSEADIILILVSHSFLATDFAWSVEMKRILERHETRDAFVIPIVVRASPWHDALFNKLQVLPRDGKPVASWRNRDKAYVDITRGIQKAIEYLTSRRREKPPDKEVKAGPAIDRWPVRTGTDKDVGKVNPDPIITTVEELIAQPRPLNLRLSGKATQYQSRRAEPLEITTWSIHAEITAFRRTQNGTYRLILRSDSGASMLAQVPNPKFVDRSSPWRDSFIAVRMKLERQLEFSGTFAYLEPPIPTQLIGIGYFGRPHGQTGAAQNGVELHPVIAFEWLWEDELESSQEPQKTKRSNKRPATKRTGPG
jgi:hypothetical protein